MTGQKRGATGISKARQSPKKEAKSQWTNQQTELKAAAGNKDM